MILLYTLMLSIVGSAHWVLKRRAASLGRAYAGRAEAVLKLMHAAQGQTASGIEQVVANGEVSGPEADDPPAEMPSRPVQSHFSS